MTCALLSNDALEDLQAVCAIALVNAKVWHFCIPEDIAARLQLQDRDRRTVTLADGQSHEVRYVSPLRIQVLGRTFVAGALVLGDRVVLGAGAMADLDLIQDPTTQALTVNPEAPTVPRSRAGATRVGSAR